MVHYLFNTLDIQPLLTTAPVVPAHAAATVNPSHTEDSRAVLSRSTSTDSNTALFAAAALPSESLLDDLNNWVIDLDMPVSDEELALEDDPDDALDGEDSEDGEDEDDVNPDSAQSAPSMAVTEEQVIALLAVNGTSTALKKSAPKNNHRPPRVPDREMCMFINAHNLPPPLRCRRYHANLFYGNNEAGA